MTFTLDVKNQLCRLETTKDCCGKAEVLGFLRMCGNVSLGGGGSVGMTATNNSAAIARRYFKMVKQLWALHSEILVRESNYFKKNKMYTLRIPPQDQVQDILYEYSKIPDGNPWSTANEIGEATSLTKVFKTDCCYRAYLRGAFLSNGFINDPKKSYHLEMVCQDIYHANFLIMLMEHYGMQAKVNERKGTFVVYLKESEQISDFLNVIGAHSALFELENVRIIKETNNNVNRVINCDTANTDKTVNTAIRQIAAITKLMEAGVLEKLKAPLQEAAELRLENPETPLEELAKMTASPITKSGFNHRLHKLEKLAEDL